jgi:hypothetical protein
MYCKRSDVTSCSCNFKITKISQEQKFNQQQLADGQISASNEKNNIGLASWQIPKAVLDHDHSIFI